MWNYPPPTNPYAPSPQMVPGGGPFQPFPGGPWYRVTSGGVLQIYYNYQWTTRPSVAPNITNPGPTPPGTANGIRGIGRPQVGTPAAGGLGIAAAALYDSLSRLWDAINAVREEEAATQDAIARGLTLTTQQNRVKAWMDWVANDPGGQKMQKVYNCTQNNIIKAQNEIDTILAKPQESRSQADYARLAVLRQAVENMVRTATFFQELRASYIQYGCISGQDIWPTQAQIDAFTCEAIPAETAPYPTIPTSQGEMATVPDDPPVECNSFLMQRGAAYPSSGDYFGDDSTGGDSTG